MGWIRVVVGGAVAAALVAAACGDEGPTGVGGPLLPGGVVRTFQVVLGPEAFLAGDTTLGGFTRPAESGYMVVAEDFGGTFDAHALARFDRLPRSVSYRDTAGATRQDTLPRFTGGVVVMRVDTARSAAAGPVRLRLHRIAEPWDPATATWTARVDSAGRRLLWARPGGTAGALVDTATWTPGTDSVSFRVDSLTIALWADTADAARGALLLAETPGARIRAPFITLRLDARPSARPDTVVTATSPAIATTFVSDPAPAPPALLAGGNPAWRAYLRFRRLDTLRLPCPAPADPGCTLRLRDATISLAMLQLQPEPVAPAFFPEDSLRLEARAVLAAPGIPLVRSPLGDPAGGTGPVAIPRARFLPGTGGPPVELPVTGFVTRLARDTLPDQPAPSVLALLSSPEGGLMGLGAFARAGVGAPRLRLVLTVATDVGIR